jgi:acyl-CoA thioesterase FadM
MKPSIRLLKTLTTAAWKGSHDQAPRPGPNNPNAETLTRWRVMPADLDLFGHMNNSRYLLLMDFARLDYLAQVGLLGAAFRYRWTVPLRTAQVDYYRPLKPFEKFEIGTQVLSWNDRWFYLRQRFRTLGHPVRTVATAHVKTIFLSPSGHVAPMDVVRMAIGHDVEAPPMSADLWARFEVAIPVAIGSPNVDDPRPRPLVELAGTLSA